MKESLADKKEIVSLVDAAMQIFMDIELESDDEKMIDMIIDLLIILRNRL